MIELVCAAGGSGGAEGLPTEDDERFGTRRRLPLLCNGRRAEWRSLCMCVYGLTESKNSNAFARHHERMVCFSNTEYASVCRPPSARGLRELS